MKDASQERRTRNSSGGKKRARSRSVKKEVDQQSALVGEDSTARQNQHRGSLNNFRTSFEQRLLDDKEEVPASPREILRRARDRSIRELS